MARGIVIQIQGDGESARRALEMVQQKLHETEEAAEREASGMAEAMERVKGALETVGLYMGVREVVSQIRELTVGSLELGESIAKASRQTGLHAETLSTLHYAAKLTGGDFDGLTGSLSKMNNTIAKAAEGDRAASAFMQGLGVNAKDLASRTDGTEVAFQAFLKTLAATESPVQRTRLAIGLLGRSGASMIPTLLEMGENWDTFKQKAQAAGVLLDGETAEKLADTSHRLADLEQHVVGAGLSFTEAMAPGLNQIFSVISSGKSQMDVMREWGQDMTKIIAFVAETAYTAAAGLEFLFSVGEGGKFTDIGQRDREAGKGLMEKAQKMHDIAFGDGKQDEQKPFLPSTGTGPGGRGFDGSGLAKPGKTLNPIAEAAAQLQQEQAKRELDLVKANGMAELAELEAQHKMQLVSDQDFYDEKFRIQNEELAAEQTSLERRRTTLQTLLQHQRGDSTLKRDGKGRSAEELKTQRELLQVQEQMESLEGKRRSAESGYNAEKNQANLNGEIAGLRSLAEIEKERGDGTRAQIALLQREAELNAQKLHNEGGSDDAVAAVRATAQLAAQKLQLNDIGQEITRTEADYSRQIDQVNDAVAKGDMGQLAGRRQVRQLQQQEAAAVQSLIEKYRELANATGSAEEVEKAKQYAAELEKLGRSDQTQTFGYQVKQGVQGITESLADMAATGRQSFSQMVNSMLQDIERLAMKMAMQKWLTPLFESSLGGGASSGGAGGGFGSLLGGELNIDSSQWEHHMSAGLGSDGPQVVGEKGIELWTPPSGGGSYTSTDMLKSLAEKGSAARTPQVTSNVINKSGVPLTSSTPKVSYKTELGHLIVETVLDKHAEGGPLRDLFGS